MATSDSVIHLDSPEEGRVLREFFEASGYNLKKLRPLWGHRGNTVILLHQTREPSLEHILVRWFVIGRAVKEETAIAFVPEEILRILVRSGLLVRRGDDLVPTVLLLPFADVLTAGDMAAESGSPPADIVIGPNAPAGSLMNFTVRRKVATALDMCCGGGIHAMKLAEHSDSVVASDLNQRAMAFARFNTRLHGVENIEFVRGDGFETVAGRSFDLIVANPPFYLLPATDLLYRDNPGDLDGFVQGLLRQAPLYLNEGGFCQMVFEWAELEGQAWPERLSEWFAETACDVWLMPQYSMTPIEYCEARMRSGGAASADKDLEMIADWSGYYRRHKVAAIHGGVVAMRKRNAAENWIRLEQGPVSIREPFGEIVEMFFHAQDMALETDDVLLASHPRLSPGARLEQISQASEEGWLRPSIALRNGNGVQRSCSVDPQVAGFLSHFNGKRSLHDLLGLLSAQPGVGAERVRSQCLAVVRQLIEQGIVLVDREPGAATPQRHGRASNLVHESAKD